MAKLKSHFARCSVAAATELGVDETPAPDETAARYQILQQMDARIDQLARTISADGHNARALVVIVIDVGDSIGNALARELFRSIGKELDRELSSVRRGGLALVLTRRDAASLFRKARVGGEALSEQLGAPPPEGKFYVAIVAARGAMLVHHAIVTESA